MTSRTITVEALAAALAGVDLAYWADAAFHETEPGREAERLAAAIFAALPAEPAALRAVIVADARWRDDSYYTFKYNHKHADSTTVAHEYDEACPEIRLVGAMLNGPTAEPAGEGLRAFSSDALVTELRRRNQPMDDAAVDATLHGLSEADILDFVDAGAVTADQARDYLRRLAATPVGDQPNIDPGPLYAKQPEQAAIPPAALDVERLARALALVYGSKGPRLTDHEYGAAAIATAYEGEQ